MLRFRVSFNETKSLERFHVPPAAVSFNETYIVRLLGWVTTSLVEQDLHYVTAFSFIRSFIALVKSGSAVLTVQRSTLYCTTKGRTKCASIRTRM